MEESLKFAVKAFRRMVIHWTTPSSSQVKWARWCLPSFNKHCDQDLKGRLADADNSCCEKQLKKGLQYYHASDLNKSSGPNKIQ